MELIGRHRLTQVWMNDGLNVVDVVVVGGPVTLTLLDLYREHGQEDFPTLQFWALLKFASSCWRRIYVSGQNGKV